MSRQYLGPVDVLQQCATNFSDRPQKSIFVNYGPAMDPRRLAQWAVIAAAGLLAIMSGVDGAGLVGQAHADDPPCVVSGPDSCPDQANLVKTNPPPPRRYQKVCQPAGMAGVHCILRPIP